MGAEQIRELLAEARRVRARWKSDPSSLDARETAEVLQLFDRLVAASEHLLQEHDQLGGRLKRKSVFTRPMSDFLTAEQESGSGQSSSPAKPQEPSSAPLSGAAGSETPH